MSPLQKYALFSLVLVGAAVALGVALATASGDPLTALAGFAIVAVRPVVRRRLGLAGWASLDEREQQVSRQASVAGYGVFWACFVAAAVAGPWLAGAGATLPLVHLPIVLVAAYAIVAASREAATLVLLARGA